MRQAVLLTIVSWVVLHAALGVEARAATAVTVAALAGFIALRLRSGLRKSKVVVTDTGLKVVTLEAKRSISWAALGAMKLSEGALETEGAELIVRYVHVEVLIGQNLAFSDLSTAGVQNVLAIEDSVPVIDIEDPELLFGTIAERTTSTEFLPDETSLISARPDGPAVSSLSHWRASLAGPLHLAFWFTVASHWPELFAQNAMNCAVFFSYVALFALSERWALRNTSRLSPTLSAFVPLTVALLFATVSLLAPSPSARFAPLLSAALFVCLPIEPLPGIFTLRRLARGLSPAPTIVIATLSLLTIFSVIALFANGFLLLPTAIFAGLLEAFETLRASRRAERLVALPKFSRWGIAHLADLRSRLRPVSLSQSHDRLRDAALHELGVTFETAHTLPPSHRSTLALIALTLAVTAMVSQLIYANKSLIEALRWITL